LIVFFSIGLITFSQKYFQAQTVTHKTDQDYLSEEKIKWDVSKISDEYLPKNFPVPEIKEEVAWQRLVQLTATAEFEKIDHRLTEQKFIIKAADSSEFLINIAAFPGWQIKVNGQKIEPEIDQGKYKLALDKGESLLELQFNNTPVRNIANLISLFWLFGFLAFIFKFNKKNA